VIRLPPPGALLLTLFLSYPKKFVSSLFLGVFTASPWGDDAFSPSIPILENHLTDDVGHRVSVSAISAQIFFPFPFPARCSLQMKGHLFPPIVC